MLALAGTAGLVLSWAAPAAAHAELVAAEPAQGAAVAVLDEVRLGFSEALLPEFATVAVTGADGVRVDAETPAVTGTQVSIPVAATTAGSYTVAYRLLSTDGHAVEGAYTLTYAPPGPGTPVPAAPSPSPPPASGTGAEAGDDAPARDSTSAALAGAVGGSLVGGAAVVAVVRRHRSRDDG